jgi:tetratricopeptide (TPR) repeat protein
MGEAEQLKLERYFVARGYSLLGLIYQGKGNYEKAYNVFSKAERVNDRDDIVKFALQPYRKALK